MPSRIHIISIAAATAFFATCTLRAQMASLPNAPSPTSAVIASLTPETDLPSRPERHADDRPAAPTPQPLDLAVTPSSQLQQPSSSLAQHQDPQQPSLGDLGLTPEQTKSDPDAQARLDRRTHMLKVHQTLGLLTTIPIAAACISSAGATPDRNSYGNTTSRDVHVGIAGLAIGMYGATAYYAIRAPRIPDSGPARGGIKLHKYLIWIHAPGMILTPILGTMAFNDIASGHKVTGIESAHGAVALTTAIAYGASILAVSWPIHIPFISHKTPQATQ